MTDDTWMARGACRPQDPALFFPPLGASTEDAKAVCALCPVRARCLEYAILEGIEHGVWGGASDAERRRIRKARGLGRICAGCTRGLPPDAPSQRHYCSETCRRRHVHGTPTPDQHVCPTCDVRCRTARGLVSHLGATGHR